MVIPFQRGDFLMQELVSLRERTVIITGAAQGIGLAAVRLAIDLGANVVAVDRNAEGLANAASEFDASRIAQVVGSVADQELAARAVEEAVQRFGAVHGLVNNAGITRPAMIEKMTLEEWRDVLDVHLNGAFYWTQAVGRHMLSRARNGDMNPGSIVNVSSDAGRRGAIGQVNYAAAKAGMLGVTMTAAREWGKHRIRSNSVCFGVVETSMTEVVRGEKFRDGLLAQIPLGYWADAADVVKTVCFLLSDASAYITGQHYGVNGGFHISL
jgi:3-oxoacyl-[acyl-carrier protein] reductase